MLDFYFTIFSESRLWECRVFTVFVDNQVMFECILQGLLKSALGTSCFLVQKCTRITKVSCLCVHVCFQHSHISYCLFAYICVILCSCDALGGRQFLRRVDV